MPHTVLQCLVLEHGVLRGNCPAERQGLKSKKRMSIPRNHFLRFCTQGHCVAQSIIGYISWLKPGCRNDNMRSETKDWWADAPIERPLQRDAPDFVFSSKPILLPRCIATLWMNSLLSSSICSKYIILLLLFISHNKFS